MTEREMKIVIFSMLSLIILTALDYCLIKICLWLGIGWIAIYIITGIFGYYYGRLFWWFVFKKLK